MLATSAAIRAASAAAGKLAGFSQYGNGIGRVGSNDSTPKNAGGAMLAHAPSSHVPITPEPAVVQSGQHGHGAVPILTAAAFGFASTLRFGVSVLGLGDGLVDLVEPRLGAEMRKIALPFVTVFLPVVFAIAIPLSCGGCQPEPATVPTVTKQPPADVHYAVLYRDLDTANAYRNVRVRCRLEPADYLTVPTLEGWELRVWAGDRAAPPVLVFQCDEGPADGSITVVGVCQGAERDGVWRSPRADFRVTVRECRVSRR